MERLTERNACYTRDTRKACRAHTQQVYFYLCTYMVYVHIYTYIIYIYIYTYIYICNHESNVPSRLSPQWLCGNSCTWAHDV